MVREYQCALCDASFSCRSNYGATFCPDCRVDARRKMRMYGLSVDELRDVQSADSCAACGEAPAGRMSIDHCHDTGVVRGLTHQRCNLGMAQAKHDPEVLFRWSVHLERHRFDLRDLCLRA